MTRRMLTGKSRAAPRRAPPARKRAAMAAAEAAFAQADAQMAEEAYLTALRAAGLAIEVAARLATGPGQGFLLVTLAGALEAASAGDLPELFDYLFAAQDALLAAAPGNDA